MIVPWEKHHAMIGGGDNCGLIIDELCWLMLEVEKQHDLRG